MWIGELHSPCTPDEYFDGIEDTCVPCENVCIQEPLTFCKNNCPEFYKKLTAETIRSVSNRSTATPIDHMFLTSALTEPSPNDVPRFLSSTQFITMTTFCALIGAVIAISVAVAAFILICKTRRREKYDVGNGDTENPLLNRTESDSLCKSNFSSISSNSDSLNEKHKNSKVPLVCNSADQPDVTREANAEDDRKISGNTNMTSSISSNGNRSHLWTTPNGKEFFETSEQAIKGATEVENQLKQRTTVEELLSESCRFVSRSDNKVSVDEFGIEKAA